MPSTALIRPALSMPWAIRSPKIDCFAAPVKIGDTVKATATITALNPDKKRATLSTVCTVGDVVVIDGEAYVQVPSRA